MSVVHNLFERSAVGFADRLSGRSAGYRRPSGKRPGSPRDTEDGARLVLVPHRRMAGADAEVGAAIIIAMVAWPTSYWSVTRRRSSGGWE